MLCRVPDKLITPCEGLTADIACELALLVDVAMEVSLVANGAGPIIKYAIAVVDSAVRILYLFAGWRWSVS